MKRSLTNSLIPITSMAVILAVAFGMDRWILFLRELNSRTASYNEVTLVSYSMGHLLLAVLLLALFYRFVFLAPMIRSAAWIFLLIGLGISLYPALDFTPIAQWFRLTLINFIGARTYFITAGAFIAVTGVASLLQKRLTDGASS